MNNRATLLNFQSERSNSHSQNLYSSLEDEAVAHMAERGFHYEGPFDTSGKTVKFAGREKSTEKTEWYKAEQTIKLDGKITLQVTYNSHHASLQSNKHHIFFSETSKPISDEELQAQHNRVAEMQKKRAADERAKENKRKLQAQADRERFNKASETGNSPYLDRKGIPEPYGARFEKKITDGKEETILLVPVPDEHNEIQALQEIYPSKRLFPGSNKPRDKNFTNAVQGLFHTIGKVENGQLIRVSEGYATAASCYESTGATVPHVVAFSDTAYTKLIPKLRSLYPDSPIQICADGSKDPGKKSSGMIEAEKAVNAVENCSFVYPVFPEGKDRDEKGERYKDFNDQMLCFGRTTDELNKGKEAVARQLSPINPAGANNHHNGTKSKTDSEKKNEQKSAKEPAEAKQPIFQPYTFSDLLTMPPKEWLLDQVFGKKDIGMIYGPPGCGKTFVVIDLIMSICTGVQWATRFFVKRPLNVAYCAGEGISGLPTRIAAAAKHHNIHKLHNFSFFKTVPQLNEESIQTTIKQFIYEWKARLMNKEAEPLDVLVIDTLHTATFGADENSSQDMGIVLHSCRLAAEELECTVILVHHTNKGGTEERGSSSLRGAMDFMIKIKPPENEGNVSMICEKLKDGETWQGQFFDLCAVEDTNSVAVNWGSLSDQQQIAGAKKIDKAKLLSEMTLYAGKLFKCKALAEVIAKSDNHTRNLLIELEKEGKCHRKLSDPVKDQSRTNPWVYYVDVSKPKNEDV